MREPEPNSKPVIASLPGLKKVPGRNVTLDRTSACKFGFSGRKRLPSNGEHVRELPRITWERHRLFSSEKGQESLCWHRAFSVEALREGPFRNNSIREAGSSLRNSTNPAGRPHGEPSFSAKPTVRARDKPWLYPGRTGGDGCRQLGPHDAPAAVATSFPEGAILRQIMGSGVANFDERRRWPNCLYTTSTHQTGVGKMCPKCPAGHLGRLFSIPENWKRGLKTGKALQEATKTGNPGRQGPGGSDGSHDASPCAGAHGCEPTLARLRRAGASAASSNLSGPSRLPL